MVTLVFTVQYTLIAKYIIFVSEMTGEIKTRFFILFFILGTKYGKIKKLDYNNEV